MRKVFFNGLLIMFSFSLIMCSNDDDGGGQIDNSQQIAATVAIAESGTWRITNFNDSGQDETSDFNGYNFNFNSDGSLNASNGSNTISGTWSVTNDSNSNDDSSNDNDIDFNILFQVANNSNFEDLNDDWDIVSMDSNTMELIDVSGGNGGTDLLTFEKN